MNAWVYPFGIAALCLAWTLRAPKPTHPYRALLFVLLGVAISATLVRLAANSAGVARPTEFDHFIADSQRLLDDEPNAPYIVFSGASFARNGIDDERLTVKLRELGYPHRAINLSLQGSSLQERHAALMRLLETAGRLPDRVFLMVAPEFDENAAYVFRVAKFSDRAIKQMDFESASWAGLGLAHGACSGLVGCVKDIGFTGVHLTINQLNLGLLSGGQNLSELSPLKVYDAKAADEVRGIQTDEEIADGVLAEPEPQPLIGPHWAASFRAQQRADLQALGVTHITYYLPPVVSAEIRNYIGSLCLGELLNWSCITPLDSELMTPLNRQVWFDPKHLQSEGAEHYTDWLARQIHRRGLLE